VLHIEQLLHLPSDLAIQRLVLPYPRLVESLNVYYLYAHLNGMVLFLVWMFWRHRDVYPRARNAIVILTAACLVIQTVPVAPPRMLTNLGFVDTALEYGQSVYGPFGSGMANQLAAMPSVHVAWALLVAYFVVTASTSRWRWLVLLHPALTVFVVVATANHYLLDGVVAAALLALTLLALAAWDRRLTATPEPRPAEMAEAGAPDGVRP
jgi:MFS superfamily sulfate permease-like transporter